MTGHFNIFVNIDWEVFPSAHKAFAQQGCLVGQNLISELEKHILGWLHLSLYRSCIAIPVPIPIFRSQSLYLAFALPLIMSRSIWLTIYLPTWLPW